jgi:hypothetical protein
MLDVSVKFIYCQASYLKSRMQESIDGSDANGGHDANVKFKTDAVLTQVSVF